MRLTILALLVSAFAAVGCEREIATERKVDVKNDGTVVKEEKKVSERPDGSIVKEETKTVDK